MQQLWDSASNKLDLFKLKDKYGKELDVRIFIVNIEKYFGRVKRN